MRKKEEKMKLDWLESRNTENAKLEHITLSVEGLKLDFELEEDKQKIVVCEDGTFKIGEYSFDSLKKAKIIVIKNVIAEVTFSITEDEDSLKQLQEKVKEVKDRMKYQNGFIDFLKKKKKNIKNK